MKKKELAKKAAFGLWHEIAQGWHWLWRIFSNDPAASCSRMLAVAVISYVGYMGMKHWDTMTQVQSTFLLGYLSGLIPYATGKLFDTGSKILASIKGTPETKTDVSSLALTQTGQVVKKVEDNF